MDGAPPADERTSGGVPSQADFLAAMGDAFAVLYHQAADLMEGLPMIADDRRRMVVDQALNSIAHTAAHTHHVIGLWGSEDPPPPEVMQLIEDDPGGLTCPRCEEPITLLELQTWGHCAACHDKAEGTGQAETEGAQA
ncbi:MAG: hypothetical protein ACREKK_05520 [Candidatus Methylomirabilales bacterium]